VRAIEIKLFALGTAQSVLEEIFGYDVYQHTVLIIERVRSIIKGTRVVGKNVCLYTIKINLKLWNLSEKNYPRP